MADKKLRLDLDIATDKAQANLKGAAKEAKKLGTELSDTRSAGKKLADAMNEVADDMEADFKQSVKAADKLEKALGVEAVAAFNKAGNSVDDLVATLKKAGLSYEDIEADVDDLAASMKRANDIGDQMDTHISKNMANVAKETDNSRSVMANFTGNAMGELPGVAGAFGPLNMAIGQFAEYAAEGNIGIGGMAKAAGAMAGVAVVFYGISKAVEALGEQERKVKARTEEVAKALDNAIQKAYEYEVATAAAGGEVDGLAAGQRGLSIALLASGDDGIRFASAMRILGIDTERAGEVISGLDGDPTKALTAMYEGMGLTTEQAQLLAAAVNDTDDNYQDFVAGVSEGSKVETLAQQMAGLAEEAGLTAEELGVLFNAGEELQDQAQNTDLGRITKEFLEQTAASNETSSALLILAEANLGVTLSQENALQVYDEYNRLLGEGNAYTRDAVLGTNEYADRVGKLQDALSDVSDEFDKGSEAAGYFNDAIDDLFGAGKDINELTEDWYSNLQSLNEAIVENGATLDVTTEAGRNNRDAVESQMGVIQGLAAANLEAGMSATEVAAQTDFLTASLKNQLLAAGFTEAQVNELLTAYGLMPEQVETTFKTAKDKETLDTINELIETSDKLNDDVILEVKTLVEQGQLDRALATLQKALGLDGSKINTTITTTHYTKNVGTIGRYAKGTTSAPGGPAVVGETGPEIVNLDKGDTVTGSNQTKRALNESAPASYVDNSRTYISMPPGTPEMTAASYEKYLRKNGRA